MKKWLKSNHNIWTLLKRNISIGQMAGYVLSNIVGLTVVLAGIMFYIDSNSTDADQDEFFSSDYLVLSKKVDGIGFHPVTFDQADIDELQQQPWIKKVGKFTSSQYTVSGAVSMGNQELSTYMFFESVPNEFFDVKPRGWTFDPEKRFVPIIVSKDYLTLYNFGFAIPQGLPQVSEELVGVVPIKLRLSGNGHPTETFDASIVGFSSRLNTIAVPQDFMDWANERYSDGNASENASRLIVQVDRMAGADIEEYFASKEIEVAGDQSSQGNISKFLSTTSVVVTTNGLLISILAVFILILSIFLLLQKSKEKIRCLMLLGYSPTEISSYYERIVVAVNLGVTIIATALSLLFRGVWAGPLAEIGLGSSSALPIVLSAVAYLLIVTAINIIVIRRYLIKIWANG